MKAGCKIACLALCCCLLLAGCGKEMLVESYDNLLKAAGELSLTPSILLVGDRQEGPDGYAGTYQADYKRFTGTETLLGGTTALETHTVDVACAIETKSGSLKLVLQRGSEEEVLLDGTGEYAGTLTLEPGSNFLCAVGESFSGTLQLDAAAAEPVSDGSSSPAA